jgi:hypothetical protein
MSCEKTTNQVSKHGAVAAGLPGVTSKSANTIGSVIARQIRQGYQKIAPIATVVVDTAQDRDKVEAAYTLGTIGAGTTQVMKIGRGSADKSNQVSKMRKISRVLGQTLALAERPPKDMGAMVSGIVLRTAGFRGIRAIAGTVAKYTVEAGTRVVGTRLAEATRTQDGGTLIQTKRRFLFLKSQKEVPLWKSRLTNLLNRNDVIGGAFDSSHVVSSEGLMIKIDGVTWHRGTTVIRMPEGRRTIAHLQTLKMPATHYYFDRPLSDEQAFEIADNKLNPETVPGYIGMISKSESLMPLWSKTKALLILTRLHWPPKRKKKSSGA